jgi:hypothetical protein
MEKIFEHIDKYRSNKTNMYMLLDDMTLNKNPGKNKNTLLGVYYINNIGKTRLFKIAKKLNINLEDNIEQIQNQENILQLLYELPKKLQQYNDFFDSFNPTQILSILMQINIIDLNKLGIKFIESLSIFITKNKDYLISSFSNQFHIIDLLRYIEQNYNYMYERYSISHLLYDLGDYS